MAQQTEFIPYEQALELKELGFDEQCFGHFSHYLNEEILTENIVSAPLYQQVFRWFREKKLLGLVNAIDDWNSWTFSILAEDCMSPFFEMVQGEEYNTYEEAELACLKKLIEIVKNK